MRELYIFVFFFGACQYPLLGQSISELDQKADSLYYHQGNYYTEEQHINEIVLRQEVLKSVSDTTSTNYRAYLAKKYASEAAYLIHQMKYKRAVELSNQAIELYKAGNISNKVLEGFMYKKMYYALAALKRYDSVYPLVKRTLRIFKDTLGPIHPFVADVEFDLGFHQNHFGDYDQVITQYKKAIDISVASLGENNAKAAIQEHHLALVYGFIGYYKKELNSYKKVIKRWEALRDYPDKSYQSIAYGSLATWYQLYGDLETAERYLSKNLHLIERYSGDLANWFNETYRGRTQNQAWIKLARLSLLKNDTAQALIYHNKIKDYFSNYNFNDPKNNPHNLPYAMSWARDVKTNLTRFEAKLYEKSNPEKAISLYEKLILDRKANDYYWSDLDACLPLGALYVNAGHFAKAKKLLQAGMETSISKSKTFDIIHFKAALANIAFLEGNLSEMRNSYEEAFTEMLIDKTGVISLDQISHEKCKPYGDKRIVDMVLTAANNFYSIFLTKKNRNDLITAHNLNILAADIFSDNYTNTLYNDQNYAKAATIYEQVLTTAYHLEDMSADGDILEKIEAMNSQHSWKKFLHSQMSKNLNVPDSVIEQENNLYAALHFYKKSLFAGTEESAEKTEAWKTKINDLTKEIDTLHSWYTIRYPAYASQRHSRFKVSELQIQLNDNEQIIKYVVGQEKIFAFSITQNTVSLFPIGSKNEIRNLVNELVKQLKMVSTREYSLLAKKMYTTLLPNEMLTADDKQDLIFVLDDVLHYIPMEALIDDKDNYLVEQHKVSYATSLLLFNNQRNVMDSGKNKLGVFAPWYKKKTSLKPEHKASAFLLGANLEAVSIANLFNAISFIGIDANKQEFIKKAQDFGVLHLAMHAAVNNVDPEFSNLSFSSGTKDNKLYVSELYGIPLNANLAVLSACNTASGELKKGEGILSISRAFTYAGVPSTIASLWSVPDKETGSIMVTFYEYLKKGVPKNEALQLAKQEYLRNTPDARLQHPYFWAGFTLNGNIAPIEIQSESKLLYYLLVGAVIFLVFWFGKRLINMFK